MHIYSPRGKWVKCFTIHVIPNKWQQSMALFDTRTDHWSHHNTCHLTRWGFNKNSHEQQTTYPSQGPHIPLPDSLGQVKLPVGQADFDFDIEISNLCYATDYLNQQTKLSEIWIRLQHFPCDKMYLKISSSKSQPFCSGLNVLIVWNEHIGTNNSIPCYYTNWIA